MERMVISGRLAAEKGVCSDEVITLNQISGGDGIYVEQSDGRYVDAQGTPKWDKRGANNLVFSHVQREISLVWVNNTFETRHTYYDIYSIYGDLMETSTVLVNGVSYNSDWFSLHSGTDSYGNEGQLLISWNGLFPIATTDDCYWRVG